MTDHQRAYGDTPAVSPTGGRADMGDLDRLVRLLYMARTGIEQTDPDLPARLDAARDANKLRKAESRDTQLWELLNCMEIAESWRKQGGGVAASVELAHCVLCAVSGLGVGVAAQVGSWIVGRVGMQRRATRSGCVDIGRAWLDDARATAFRLMVSWEDPHTHVYAEALR